MVCKYVRCMSFIDKENGVPCCHTTAWHGSWARVTTFHGSIATYSMKVVFNYKYPSDEDLCHFGATSPSTLSHRLPPLKEIHFLYEENVWKNKEHHIWLVDTLEDMQKWMISQAE